MTASLYSRFQQDQGCVAGFPRAPTLCPHMGQKGREQQWWACQLSAAPHQKWGQTFNSMLSPPPSICPQVNFSVMSLLLGPFKMSHPSYTLDSLPRWLSSKEPACQCRRPRFDPWVRKMPWSRKW